MIVLCGDTSSSTGALALFEVNNHSFKCLGTSHWAKKSSHSDIISIELEKLLQSQHLDTSHIDAYLCGVGPGSFTGIRVALNLFRGLAYIHNKECLGISSTELLVQNLKPTELPILVLINAFRNLVYTQKFIFKNGEFINTTPLEARPIEQIMIELQTPHLVLGSGYSVFKPRIPSDKLDLLLEDLLSEASSLSDLGPFIIKNLKNSSFFKWKELQPLYIRDSEAEEKLRTGELKPVKLL